MSSAMKAQGAEPTDRNRLFGPEEKMALALCLGAFLASIEREDPHGDMAHLTDRLGDLITRNVEAQIGPKEADRLMREMLAEVIRP